MSAAGRLVRASRNDSSGQTLTLVAILLPLLLGMLGLAIDTGNLYIAQRHLQTATDAAALAAAQDLPDGTQALSVACTFSATHAGGSCPSGVASVDGQNVSGQLANVSTSAQLECLSAASAGAGCVTGTGCPTPGCNAIKITQTGSVKTFLLGFLGFVNTKVTTSATASMGGGRSSPLDVEVVLDSTSSMQAFDNCGAPSGTSGVTGIPYSSGKTPTAEDCAKAGMRALLETLYPCDPDDSASATSCGTPTQNNFTDPKPEDEVGLMSIPPLGGNPNPPSGHPAYVSPGNGLGIPAETNCIDDLSRGGYFRYPNGSDVTTSNYDPSNLPQYQFVPLSSDYKLSNATSPMNDSLLNPDSNLVKAVYWGKCPGGVYPVNGGSQGSSLSTPGAGDSSTANNNNSSLIAGGPNTPGYSTATTNGGATSISVTRPSPGAAGDYVLVSVTASGVGAGGSLYVCPPSDDTWTTISEKTQGSGVDAVTQAVFGSLRTAASDPLYTFTFVNGTSCSGSPASVQASAVVTRYTGVDVTNPIDAVGGSATSQTLGTPTPGSGTTLSAPAVSTTHASDQVVRIYSDASSAVTLQNQSAGQSQASSASSNVTAVTDKAQAGAGTTGSTTATTVAAHNWIAQTVALEPQQGQTTITINRPSTRAAGDLLIVSVTAQGQVSICAPDASWTDVGTGAVASGTGATGVTTEAFYSYRSSLDPTGQAYSFSIVDGLCGSGTPVARPATAVAVRYSGAIPVGPPIEVARSNTGSGVTPTTSSVNTGNINDTILSLYGSSATSFSSGVSQSASGADTASAYESTVQTAPGPTSPQSATTSTAGPWVSLTVAIVAADGGCSGNCTYGLEDPGGASTYYANAITAAKGALDAAESSRPDAKKVIILLSDGVANVYSSTPCQDAIKNAMAAETATATSTAATIYTIAYGDSGDHCSDSRSLTALGTSVPMTGACAMRLIADNPKTDTTHGLAGGSVAGAQAALCSGTIATDAPEHFYVKASGSDLASVFREIGQTLTSPRLVSDSAT